MHTLWFNLQNDIFIENRWNSFLFIRGECFSSRFNENVFFILLIDFFELL